MNSKYDFSLIRTLRRKLKLTLEELAKASGLSYPTVVSTETNKAFPSLKTLDAIATALGIPAGSLLTLAQRHKVKTRHTESIHAEDLKSSGINLEKINVANFEGLKIFRACATSGEVVHSMKLHENCDCHEICYCIEGSIEIRVKGSIHQLNQNDVILFDGAVEHEYMALDETEYIVIHLPKDASYIEGLLKKTAE